MSESKGNGHDRESATLTESEKAFLRYVAVADREGILTADEVYKAKLLIARVQSRGVQVAGEIIDVK